MDTDDLNVDTLTWPSFDVTADAMGNSPEPPIPVVVEEAETTTAQPTAPAEPHMPTFHYADFPPGHRVGAVPEALRQFLVEATPQGYTPPFYVDRGGKTRAAACPIPACPPIEVGGKALVFDDWGNPRVIVVTGMRGGEITGMFGSLEIQCQAWVAMSAEAPLTESPVTADGAARLSAEEADALDAEFAEWSKFLGYRAEKYRWCGTFENILNAMGIKPWRPGYKTVTLQLEVEIDSKVVLGMVTEKIGGESTLRSTRVMTQVVLKDIERDVYDAGRWEPLLKAQGYKNFRNVGVLAKEAMSL